MLTRMLLAAAVLGLAAVPAGAGDDAAHAEMMNCAVCKPMIAHMAELGPVCGHEVIRMDNGVAMRHWVNDPAKAKLFFEVSDAMDAAGRKSAGFTAEQAENDLCAFCRGRHGLISAGASMSSGRTENGTLQVITSNDPAVREKIAAFYDQATEMMGG